MYCKCPQPRKVLSSAGKDKFEVCSKNLGGCGCEIRELSELVINPHFTSDIAGWRSPNITGEDHAKEECPQCCGDGMIARMYPNGHTEVTCDECDGRGWI